MIMQFIIAFNTTNNNLFLDKGYDSNKLYSSLSNLHLPVGLQDHTICTNKAATFSNINITSGESTL